MLDRKDAASAILRYLSGYARLVGAVGFHDGEYYEHGTLNEVSLFGLELEDKLESFRDFPDVKSRLASVQDILNGNVSLSKYDNEYSDRDFSERIGCLSCAEI